MTPELLIETENRVKELWEKGELPYLTHLCGGNEEWLCGYYSDHVGPNDWVFCSHRTHYHALLYGIEPDDLIARIRDGKSMFIYGERFVCSAIVAGVCSITAGRALGMKLTGEKAHVHCFVGDGATDEGSFWEALRFSEGWDLPITFIVEDNGGQCGVDQGKRWGGEWPMIGRLLDSPKVRYYAYHPTHPHAGTLDSSGKPTRPPIRFP